MGCEGSGVQISPSRPINYSETAPFSSAFVADPRSTPTCAAAKRRCTNPACEGRETKSRNSGVQISPSRPINYSETAPFSNALVADPRSTPIAFAQQMRTYSACEGRETKSRLREFKSPRPDHLSLPFNHFALAVGSQLPTHEAPQPAPQRSEGATNPACEGRETKSRHPAVQIRPSRPF